MFELLDDAHRATQQKAILRPRYAVWAVLWLLLIGAETGILLGKRDWDLTKWFQVAFQGIIFAKMFMPLFREIYKFLKDQTQTH